MPLERLFVTAVAIGLGVLGLVAAVHNRDVYFRLPKAQWIERQWGRGGARIAYAVLGLALITLGVVVAVRR